MIKRRLVVASLIFALTPVVSAMAGATIVIENADGPGEGFNETTPFSSVGGNTATTVGEARLNAFHYAANLWAGCINSPVDITVRAQMDPLFCNSSHAVLGSASATTVHRNFAGVQPGVWYPQSIANALAGLDLSWAQPDIEARFNSNLNGDQGCLSGIGWYYGFDQQPGGDIDFVTVVFHEIGHGLGFQPFMNAGGQFFLGFPDIYVNHLYDAATNPPAYPDMTDSQRAACNVDAPRLVWNGNAVTGMGEKLLTEGLNDGRVRIYAPNPYENGSSLSHFSRSASPNQFMEPAYTGPNHDIGLAIDLLKDIGWSVGAQVTIALAGGAPRSGVTFPKLRTQVALADLGASDAFGVTATMSGGPAWLVITDAECTYGDIAASQWSDGDEDGFELDLSAWPGGAFTVDVHVTWDDACGLQGSAVLKKTFDDVLTGVTPLVPARDELAQNVPNPFNPTTEITYTLAHEGHVDLVVFDVAGRRIRALVNGRRSAGPNHIVWNGQDDVGHRVASGVYFYRIRTAGYEATRRMVLLK